jgi:hypothetical protein
LQSSGLVDHDDDLAEIGDAVLLAAVAEHGGFDNDRVHCLDRVARAIWFIGYRFTEKPLSNQSAHTTPAHVIGQHTKETPAASKEQAGAHTVHRRPLSSRDRLLAMVRDAKGSLRTGHRALGDALGVSATRTGQLLKDLVKDGAIRVRAGKTGSVITLTPRIVGKSIMVISDPP